MRLGVGVLNFRFGFLSHKIDVLKLEFDNYKNNRTCETVAFKFCDNLLRKCENLVINKEIELFALFVDLN